MRVLATCLTAVTLSACLWVRGDGFDCSPKVDPAAQPFSAALSHHLPGEFFLVARVEVEDVRREIGAGTLQLAVGSDSAVAIAGSYVAEDSPSDPEPAVVREAELLVGCVGNTVCLDDGPIHHRIEGISPSGFWGYWRYPSAGTVFPLDRRGNRYTPAGRFCATRLDPIVSQHRGGA